MSIGINGTVAIALVAALSACGGQSPMGTEHGHSSATSDTQASTDGTAGSSTTSSGSPQLTSSSGNGQGGETSSSSDDGVADESSSGGVPFPEVCFEPDPVIVVGAAETPDGPVQIEEAWFILDYCSSLPHVMLFQPASVESGPEIQLDIEVQPEGDFPLVGVHSAAIAWMDGPTGTIEFLSPYESATIGTPDATKRLHAQIEIHDADWDLSVEVDLIYCGFSDCYCPCR